jgi:aminopeptidase N
VTDVSMSATPAGADVDPYTPGHGDLTFDVVAYDVSLDYRVASNHLDARARLDVIPLKVVDRLTLDLSGLDVRKVQVDGRPPTSFSARGGRLRIRLAAPAAAGVPLRVDIRYVGNPRPMRSTWGDIGWEELTDGALVAAQPSGAPSWFPCNDRPTNKATYRTSVTTGSEYTVVANGVLTSRDTRGSRTTWVYEQRQPMATYLASVQVGRYQRRDPAGQTVPVHLYRPAHLATNTDRDLERQAQMLEVFSEAFGPYPFDGYSVVVTEDELEIPLEAQGMSVFGANHVDGHRGHERLVAHELAHQWFGNSLTLGRWSDIWLHEGFACYAEWLWSERSGGESADSHARKHHAILAGMPARLVIADPGPDDMFDDVVYKRGALTLHALRMTLGDRTFFAKLRDWVAGHRYQTVSTDLFERHWCDEPEMSRLLDDWLRRRELPGLPRG